MNIDANIVKWILENPVNCPCLRNFIFAVLELEHSEHAAGTEQYPVVGAELHRCFLFIDAFPEYEGSLDKVASINSNWESIVSKWYELKAISDDYNGSYENPENPLRKRLWDVIGKETDWDWEYREEF